MRQLLKVQRLAHHLSKGPTDGGARRSINAKTDALQEHYPELHQEQKWTKLEDLEVIDSIVERRQAEERAWKLQRWQLRMQADDNLRKWVARDDHQEEVTAPCQAIHPQLRAT